MKVLIIGSGGREHALAWNISQSQEINTVYVSPGNGGTNYLFSKNYKIKNLPLINFEEIVSFAKKEMIDLTIVGPEKPLENGIVNLFRSQGLRIFGPTKEAAQLESSKIFAKCFMQKNNIPTARYETFFDNAAAHTYVQNQTLPIVIKADGLASGKGVIIAKTKEEAHLAIEDMLVHKKFGTAGHGIIIEEFLTGTEVSFIVVTNGHSVLPLSTSQDKKKLLDKDMGPNTGGMGAFSPSLIVTPKMHKNILKKIIFPTLQGMLNIGHPYTGFLYAGLIIDEHEQIKVLEFNCRMGDPESQVIIPRILYNVADLLNAAIDGDLDKINLTWDSRFAVGVIMASKNYPNLFTNREDITGILEQEESSIVFHSGTIFENHTLKTNGGRVLCVVSLDHAIAEAAKQTYNKISKIQFNGAKYRTDIGLSY